MLQPHKKDMDWKWQVSIDHNWMEKIVNDLGITELNHGAIPLSRL